VVCCKSLNNNQKQVFKNKEKEIISKVQSFLNVDIKLSGHEENNYARKKL